MFLDVLTVGVVAHHFQTSHDGILISLWWPSSATVSCVPTAHTDLCSCLYHVGAGPVQLLVPCGGGLAWASGSWLRTPGWPGQRTCHLSPHYAQSCCWTTPTIRTTRCWHSVICRTRRQLNCEEPTLSHTATMTVVLLTECCIIPRFPGEFPETSHEREKGHRVNQVAPNYKQRRPSVLSSDFLHNRLISLIWGLATKLPSTPGV